MKEPPLRRPVFLGTYFDASTVFRIVKGCQMAAWLILVLYLLETALHLGVFLLQIGRGLMMGMGVSDYVLQAVFFAKMPLAGVLFFFALQAIAQGLLILLDIEANSRRGDRGGAGG